MADSAPPARVLTQEEIQDIFEFYANFGRSSVMTYQDSLDSFMFMKFAKECPGLIDDATLNRTEVDLIFTKARPKFERRLDFEHFLDALAAISERKYPDYSPADGLRLLISNNLAPLHDHVKVEMQKTGETEIPLEGIFKKLYDPRSYTGVYAERFRSGDGRINGEADNRPGRVFNGSTNTGTNETIHNISVLMRPHLAGGGTMMAPANHLLYKRDPSMRSKSPSQSRIHASPSRAGSVTSSSPRPMSASASFASPMGGHGGRAPTPASTPAGAASAAKALGLDAAALSEALARAQAGDMGALMGLSSKIAELVKGQEAGQTPGAAASSREAELAADIAHLTQEQTAADAAGDVARSAEIAEAIRKRSQALGGLQSQRGSPSLARSGASVSGSAPLTQENIKEIFEFYANFGRSSVMTYQTSIDSFNFMKFAKECPGLLDRELNRTEVDLIFTKAKPKFERRLHFTHFLDALAAISERKYPDYSPADGLRLLISNNLAPLYDVVKVEMQKTGETEIPLEGIFKKLYDPRSYTGVYAERFRSGDGRINGEADNRPGRVFNGSTNTGTNETIHDISVLMRPNLRGGSMMTTRPGTSGGSPRRAVQAARSPAPRSSMGSPSRGDTGSVSGSTMRSASMSGRIY